MTPNMSAAAGNSPRDEAGRSTANPTHACSGPLSSRASSDCEEKRDPDERHRSHVKNHKRELDPNARLEKLPLVRRSYTTFRLAASARNFVIHLRLVASASFATPATRAPGAGFGTPSSSQIAPTAASGCSDRVS